MKGYKALDMDMRAVSGNGMQYEMGKSYAIEEKVVPCYKGFHFCKSIEELNGYYSIKNSRIFEIEAAGEIIERNDTYAAEKIMLVRELTKEEVNDYFKQNQRELIKCRNWNVRIAVAEQGYGLEELVCDENWYVRAAVAGQGYGLDVLVNDDHWYVRVAVAEQGYGLDKLIQDKNCCVRVAAARQSYGLDTLIHDENYRVRMAVAKQGYGLDVLVHDDDCDVRCAVAERGYGLDVLVHDDDYDVRQTAKKMAEKKGTTAIW